MGRTKSWTSPLRRSEPARPERRRRGADGRIADRRDGRRRRDHLRPGGRRRTPGRWAWTSDQGDVIASRPARPSTCRRQRRQIGGRPARQRCRWARLSLLGSWRPGHGCRGRAGRIVRAGRRNPVRLLGLGAILNQAGFRLQPPVQARNRRRRRRDLGRHPGAELQPRGERRLDHGDGLDPHPGPQRRDHPPVGGRGPDPDRFRPTDRGRFDGGSGGVVILETAGVNGGAVALDSACWWTSRARARAAARCASARRSWAPTWPSTGWTAGSSARARSWPRPIAAMTTSRPSTRA